MKNIIELRNIYKSYMTKYNKTEVLKDVNLQVVEGEFLCIMGKSGSGKSTLLNILGGMDRFESGTYLFDQVNIYEASKKDIAFFRNRNIGYIFQGFNLIQSFSAIENVELPMGIAKEKQQYIKNRAKALLESVGLGDKLSNKPYELSGGQQQRVAIARAIANKPKLILADEPTGNLDEESSQQIMELLKELNEKYRTTIIMVTHDHGCSSYSNRVIEMKNGKLINK